MFEILFMTKEATPFLEPSISMNHSFQFLKMHDASMSGENESSVQIDSLLIKISPESITIFQGNKHRLCLGLSLSSFLVCHFLKK